MSPPGDPLRAGRLADFFRPVHRDAQIGQKGPGLGVVRGFGSAPRAAFAGPLPGRRWKKDHFARPTMTRTSEGRKRQGLSIKLHAAGVFPPGKKRGRPGPGTGGGPPDAPCARPPGWIRPRPSAPAAWRTTPGGTGPLHPGPRQARAGAAHTGPPPTAPGPSAPGPRSSPLRFLHPRQPAQPFHFRLLQISPLSRLDPRQREAPEADPAQLQNRVTHGFAHPFHQVASPFPDREPQPGGPRQAGCPAGRSRRPPDRRPARPPGPAA